MNESRFYMPLRQMLVAIAIESRTPAASLECALRAAATNARLLGDFEELDSLLEQGADLLTLNFCSVELLDLADLPPLVNRPRLKAKIEAHAADLACAEALRKAWDTWFLEDDQTAKTKGARLPKEHVLDLLEGGFPTTALLEALCYGHFRYSELDIPSVLQLHFPSLLGPFREALRPFYIEALDGGIPNRPDLFFFRCRVSAEVKRMARYDDCAIELLLPEIGELSYFELILNHPEFIKSDFDKDDRHRSTRTELGL